MINFLMNPWTITIIGGVIVGLLVFFISKSISAKGKKHPSDATNNPQREHNLNAGKKALIKSGGDVIIGDKGAVQSDTVDRQHKIQADDEGTIEAIGDVVIGDKLETKGAK